MLDVYQSSVRTDAAGNSTILTALVRAKRAHEIRELLLARIEGVEVYLGHEEFRTTGSKRPRRTQCFWLLVTLPLERYDIINILGVDAVNYDIDSNVMIKFLRLWEEQCDFRVTSGGHDELNVIINRMPDDKFDFCRASLNFAPRIMDDDQILNPEVWSTIKFPSILPPNYAGKKELLIPKPDSVKWFYKCLERNCNHLSFYWD
ncbi:DUF4253 domain-containing protein [Mariniblastus sp.]|nr:DUF4253 domain-containing protein [Mariniblastus sp.]